MTERTTIQKQPIRLPSQDYELLRKEGLKHIESLSHDLWTDYNSHDPGITILEALCYAITELGYRCGFDMKDLVVTEGPGITDRDRLFFTAKEILTINPLTINDYRKLLVDINGIHNAWLLAADSRQNETGKEIPVNEVPLYADFMKDKLTSEEKTTAIFISGLYQVLLDLEYDDLYGDMNTGDIIFPNPRITGFSAGEFMLSFELQPLEIADILFAEKAASVTPDHITGITVSPNEQQWACKITLDDTSSLDFAISIPKKPAGKVITEAVITTMLGNGFMQTVFQQYLLKLEKVKKILQSAIKKLHEKRNLCEDFLSVKPISSEEISFCFDIDVLPSADIEKVQAEVFFAIENYLNPPVEFYSLRELLDKNTAVDEIFNGPVLEHGFIDNDQLEQTQLRTVIHTSDIINLLMDIESVLAIRHFVMTKHGPDGKAIPGETGLTWCMHITSQHKPVLAQERSKIILFKNQFPFLARYSEVKDTVLLLHAQRAKDKLNGLQQDIPIPAGNKRDTESFWPVQYDLPQTYGVGLYGLPANATEQRLAQQKQLKAYLLFYEQLLADFFSQFTNAYKLFSIADIKQTYHAQFLDAIKDIDDVYQKTGTTVLLKDAIDNADSIKAPRNNWQSLYENAGLFRDRRNRFLDHLLARFAESFNDYALMMYSINYEERTEEKISYDELTKAKIKTLRDYPEISSGRGKAFNYYPQLDDFSIDGSRLWDTDNVSGLEKRICSLTDTSDETRRFLFCIQNIEIVCVEKTIEENGVEKIKCFHEFTITSPSGKMMKNSNEYETKADAEKALLKVIELGKNTDNYSYVSAEKKLRLSDGDHPLNETGKDSFSNDEEAMQAAHEFADAFATECSDPAGLHLIEHILLRPRDNIFNLMEVCMHNGECPCEIDPYTFRVSVVLPYWPGHFDNMAFREYFESKIREEAPAHILLKVCWLSNDLMRDFEIRYKKWIETMVAYTEDKNNAAKTDIFRKANDKMIEILSQLHSEYPQATLHDCDESKEGSNTVVLGKTVLGKF